MLIEIGVKLMVLLTLYTVDCYQSGTKSLNKNQTFDFFVFAQQWPVAVCEEGERQHHSCVIPRDVSGWGVHGLWPSKYEEKEFINCDNEKKFDIKQIKALLPQLEKSWPNLYNDTAMSTFWEHEWQKHGTCALSNQQTSNEFKYFNKGLHLHAKYSPLRLLRNKGIIPSQTATFNYTDVIGALKTILTVQPVLGCIKDSVTGKFMMSQIEICLNNDFKLIDCHSKNDSCPKDATIEYPVIRRKETNGNTLFFKSFKKP